MRIILHQLTSTKIFIVDFEDSFTYNIASDLYQISESLQVVNHQNFFEVFYPNLINTKDKIVIVLGPGPGHPHDYQKYFNLISLMLNNKNIFILGICLGHQILGSIFNFEIINSNQILHGENIKMRYKNCEILVQRYNSLAVKSKNWKIEKSVINNEVYIFEDEGLISYQFHPESIGTSKNFDFYAEISVHLGK